jgi:transcription termination factor 2
LGKTLTVISLILKQYQLEEAKDEDEEEESDSNDEEDEAEDQWIARGHKGFRNGGSLIICPASLITQWEAEIKSKVKRGALDVLLFHGPKRTGRPKDLVKYDVVITTYAIVSGDHKNDGALFGVKWNRVVLDEGHVIRNYRTKQAEAVCALNSRSRWVLTGTPVHNKE